MGLTLYVDGSVGVGNGRGTDVDPYGDLQDAIDDIIVATGDGHTVYCRGTQNLTDAGTSTINMTNAPDGGPWQVHKNKIIGCPSDSWVPDNNTSRFILDGTGSTQSYGLDLYNIENWEVRNIEVRNMTSGSGFHPYGYQYTLFYNCIARNNSGSGFGCSSPRSLFYRCAAINNGSDGWYQPRYSQLAYCAAIGNSGKGFNLYDCYMCYGLLAANNGGDGIYSYGNNNVANSLAYNNGGHGINNPYGASLMIGNRAINNNDYGIYNYALYLGWVGQSVALGNGSGEVPDNFLHLLDDVITSGVAGLNDPDNGDFNLTNLATGLNIPVIIPTS